MRTRSGLARTLAMVTMAVPFAAEAVTFDYHVEAGIEHNDNVNLSENDPASADIIEPKFGFSLLEDGSTVQAEATGIAEYRDFLGGEFADELRGELSGHVNWTMVPDRLNLTVEDFLGVEPINTLEPNTPGNQQQTNVFAIGPTFDFRLGSAMRGRAELRYISSYAEKTQEFNTNRGSAALRGIRDLDSASAISANVEDEFVDFTNSSGGPNYRRYSVFGRYTRKWAKIDLATDAGWGWLNYSGNALQDHDDPLGRVKVGWHATERSTFSVDAAYQFSDSASDMIDDMTIGGKPPDTIVTGSSVTTSQPYLERLVGLGYGYVGDRSTFNIAPYYRKLDYVGLPLELDTLGNNQTSFGGNASLSWTLRPLLTAALGATYENLRYDTIDREDKTWTVSAMLSQQWSRNISGHISLTHYDRNSSAPGESADQNVIYVAVTYTR
jgi:hypothetical protein